MKKMIALAYRVNGGEWEHPDDEMWLGPDEAYFVEAMADLREEIASDRTIKQLEFRYEIWAIDDTDNLDLAGDYAFWSVTYPGDEDGESHCDAEAALRSIIWDNREGERPVKVERLVRIETYSEPRGVAP